LTAAYLIIIRTMRNTSMDVDFKQILRGSMGKDDGVEHHFEGDALVIECFDCEYTPEPGSKECLKCMVDRMSESGGTKRIVLRTGRDLEISGSSGQIIKSISSMKSCSTSLSNSKGRCKRCPSSRNRVMEALWEDFPFPDYVSAKATLSDGSTDEKCTRCIASTQRTISQIESDLEDIRKGVARG